MVDVSGWWTLVYSRCVTAPTTGGDSDSYRALSDCSPQSYTTWVESHWTNFPSSWTVFAWSFDSSVRVGWLTDQTIIFYVVHSFVSPPSVTAIILTRTVHNLLLRQVRKICSVFNHIHRLNNSDSSKRIARTAKTLIFDWS